MTIQFMPEFLDDLDEIFSYIADNFDDELAQEKVAKIYDECYLLEENPKLGKLFAQDNYFRFFSVLKKERSFLSPGKR